jgi:hypothetical protein
MDLNSYGFCNCMVYIDREVKKMRYLAANNLPLIKADEELVEISLRAAIGNYVDTLADGLKIPVELMVTEALGQ